MRRAEVYLKNEFVGTLTEVSRDEYIFRYDDKYFNDQTKPAISLTLNKKQQEYRSNILFPFFFNMLSEGHNRKVQARYLHIDEDDHFGILLATAQYDAPGAVIVKAL